MHSPRLLSYLICLVLLGCEEPGIDDESTVFRDQAPIVGDVIVSAEEELLGEKFDPNALYVEADDEIAGAVVAGAKQLTDDYSDVVNPKVRARQVQRLVRASLEADVLVVAQVVARTQEDRSGGDGSVTPWTLFDFEVAKTVAADSPVEEFTLEKLGGQIDGYTTTSCGMPDFGLDQTYLVALRRGKSEELFLANEQSGWVVVGDQIVGVELSVQQLQAAKEGWQ